MTFEHDPVGTELRAAPSELQRAVFDPVLMWGISDSVDFETNAWTFTMKGPYAVSGGAYAILYNDDWQEIVEALKGVIAVADRETDEFIRARAALAKVSS